MEELDLITEQTNFLNELELKGKSFNTVKNYRTDLNIFNQFLGAKGAGLYLKEFSAEQVKEYSRFLNQKYDSPNSVRRRVQALRIFFDWLIERGRYQENPIKKALVAPKVVDPPRPLRFHQVCSLRDHLVRELRTKEAYGKGPLERLICIRNLVLFHLIYGAGLKVSDLETLKASAIFSGDPGRVMVSSPKRDPYTIPLPPGLLVLAQEYQAALAEQKDKDQVEFDHLLFNANPYKILRGGLSSRGIETLFNEFSNKLGFPATAKTLRQSCIFKWIGMNRSDSQIKEWMGVQPVYSLKPYKELMQERPDEYAFQEIEANLKEDAAP